MAADPLRYVLDGFAFGVGTPWFVQDVEVGEADGTSNDAAIPRQDGQRFGRDFRTGRVITFEIVIMSGNGAQALTDLATINTAWLGDSVRATPGAVSVLSMTRGGRTRRVYGRPRRFAVASERTLGGHFSIVCDFQCVDHLFYGDAELSTVIGMSAPSIGGLVGPLIGPIDAESAGEGVQSLFVGGTIPGWLTMRIKGPIVDPIVELVGHWSAQLKVTLPSDDYVVIDPSPWNRAVRRAGGGNLSGAFTASSRRLSQMRIPPGHQQILLRGIDPTGTASVTAAVREAYPSY